MDRSVAGTTAQIALNAALQILTVAKNNQCVAEDYMLYSSELSL